MLGRRGSVHHEPVLFFFCGKLFVSWQIFLKPVIVRGRTSWRNLGVDFFFYSWEYVDR